MKACVTTEQSELSEAKRASRDIQIEDDCYLKQKARLLNAGFLIIMSQEPLVF
jgi:hypothetical protein